MFYYIKKRLEIANKQRNIMVLFFGTAMFWIFSVMATSAFCATPMEPSDYTSLFQIPQVRTYCSDEKVNSLCSDGGRVVSGTCGEGDLAGYPYCCAEDITGFKNLYDFSDPRICLQMDSEISEWCDKEQYRISAVAPQEYGGLWGPCGKLSAFRVFIPPGTTSFDLTLYIPRDDMIGMVARFKEVPECEFCAGGGSEEYKDLPVSFENDIVLDEEMASLSTRTKAVLTNQDVYQRNSGGHILLGFGFPEALTEDRAGWLFIRMIPFRDNRIASLQFSIKVDAEKYREWFSNANWDICGDPWMTGAPENAAACQPSTPSAPAQPSSQDSDSSGSSNQSDTQSPSAGGSSDSGCSIENPGACSNSYACASNGGCWVSDRCISMPAGGCPSSTNNPNNDSGSSSNNLNPFLDLLSNNTPNGTSPSDTQAGLVPLPQGHVVKECDNSCQTDGQGARVITALEGDRLRMNFSSPPYDGKVYVYAVMTVPDNSQAVCWNDGKRHSGYIQDLSEVRQYWTGDHKGTDNIDMDDIMVCATGLGGERVQILTPGKYVLYWMITTEGPELASFSENDPYELLSTTITIPECK